MPTVPLNPDLDPGTIPPPRKRRNNKPVTDLAVNGSLNDHGSKIRTATGALRVPISYHIHTHIYPALPSPSLMTTYIRLAIGCCLERKPGTFQNEGPYHHLSSIPFDHLDILLWTPTRWQPWCHPPRSTSVSCASHTASRKQNNGTDASPSLVLILFYDIFRTLARPSIYGTYNQNDVPCDPFLPKEAILVSQTSRDGRTGTRNPFMGPGDRTSLGRSMSTAHEHRRSFLKAGVCINN